MDITVITGLRGSGKTHEALSRIGALKSGTIGYVVTPNPAATIDHLAIVCKSSKVNRSHGIVTLANGAKVRVIGARSRRLRLDRANVACVALVDADRMNERVFIDAIGALRVSHGDLVISASPPSLPSGAWVARLRDRITTGKVRGTVVDLTAREPIQIDSATKAALSSLVKHFS